MSKLSEYNNITYSREPKYSKKYRKESNSSQAEEQLKNKFDINAKNSKKNISLILENTPKILRIYQPQMKTLQKRNIILASIKLIIQTQQQILKEKLQILK